MPTEHLKHNNNDNKYYNMKSVMKEETSQQHHHHHQNTQQQQNLASATKHTKTLKKRKHNDSISESMLIREKLPSSSLATIGKNKNLLIPRNNHTILNSIDLKETDGAALKKLMNNNNCDLTNGDNFDDEEDMVDNSDSETVTGDESLFEPEDEEETESDEFIDDDIEVNRKIYGSNSSKKKSSIIATMD